MSARRHASDPHGTGLATVMGGHARVGRGSWLRALDAGVLDRIGRLAVVPIVERPIVVARRWQEVPGADDYLSAYSGEGQMMMMGRLWCTVLQDGVAVFRARVPERLEYVSREFAGRVRVSFVLDSERVEPSGKMMKIVERVCTTEDVGHNASCTNYERLQVVNLSREAMDGGFRARNGLGVELWLASAEGEEEEGALTPMVVRADWGRAARP